MNPITFTVRKESYSLADHWAGLTIIAVSIIVAAAAALYLVKHKRGDVPHTTSVFSLVWAIIAGLIGVATLSPTPLAHTIAKEAYATSGYDLRFLSDASFREDTKQTDLVVSLSKEGQREVKNCFLSTIPNRDVIHVIIDGCRAA